LTAADAVWLVLVERLSRECGISSDAAARDADGFLEQLTEHDLLDETP
jgi:hypothetical protein